MIAQQQTRSVRRYISQRWSGQFIGKRQRAGLAVRDERLGQDSLAVFDLRKIDAGAVGRGSRKTFEERIAG